MSRLLSSSDADVARAARALRQGRLVAFPTETVYGLGAAARDPDAVARIYRAKGRPRGHPVIVHIAEAAALARWARRVPRRASLLADAFWPGPLTLVLPRADGVPDAVTGGQATVAVRVPDHPVALGLLRSFGDGVAAPSANRFGHVSPTTAAHVAEEFAGVDVLVLDGGPCRVGVESTIIDLSGPRPRLLRPGGASLEAVEAVLGDRLELGGPRVAGRDGEDAPPPRVPGSLPRHYAPRAPTELVAPGALHDRAAALIEAGEAVGVLARRAGPAGFEGCWQRMPEAPAAYAHELYAALRRLDAAPGRRILVESVPATAPWLAIRDRLRRATAQGDRREPDPAPPETEQEGT